MYANLDDSFEFMMLEGELPVSCMPSCLFNIVLSVPQQACLLRVHVAGETAKV